MTASGLNQIRAGILKGGMKKNEKEREKNVRRNEKCPITKLGI